MQNAEYVDLVRLNMVDDSIGPFYQFAYLLNSGLGHQTTREWELPDLL
jgi:hypothetical protein